MIYIARKIHKKRGVAFFIVIAIMFILSLLMLQFHFSSRQAQSTAHRFQSSEMARQLAATAQEEAFTYLYNKTTLSFDSGSYEPNDVTKQILNREISIEDRLDNKDSVKGIDLKVPLTQELADDLQPGVMDIKATARIVDFRNKDYKGNTFYDKEGIGTIEIAVTVKAKENRKKAFPGSCNMIRHYAYKVVSIISNKENRENSYVENSLLDYVLFLRNGQEEYDTTNGVSINPPDTTLEVNAKDETATNDNLLGKINLGYQANKHQCLNLAEGSDMLESSDEKTIDELNEEIAGKDSTVNDIFPIFREELQKTIEGEGLKLVDLTGHTLKFFHKYSPFPVDNTIGKGITIKPVDKLKEIIDCDLRKRFFNEGYFKFDLSKCTITMSEVGAVSPESQANGAKLDELKSKVIYCLDLQNLKNVELENKVQEYQNKLNFKKLENFIKDTDKKKPERKIASRAFFGLNEEYPYCKGEEEETFKPQNQFYKISKESTPSDNTKDSDWSFGHFNLWNKRLLELNSKTNDFVDLEIYDKENNILHLRGVMHSVSPITLGEENKTLVVDGCGVLIANGITINGAIKKKNPKSVCVLMSRDADININTNKEIQAALIALGRNTRNCIIHSNEELNLKGAIIADKLNLSSWKKNVNHKITYDSALAPVKDIYQINITRQVSFERITEKE